MIDGDGNQTPIHRVNQVNEILALCEKANREHTFEPKLSAIRVYLYQSFDYGVYNPFGQAFNLAKLVGMRFDPGHAGGPAYLVIDDATEEQIEFAKLVLTDYGFLWCMTHRSFAH